MNLSILKAFFDRLSVRTKLIGMAVIAFLIGTFFGGRGTSEVNGRYVPWGCRWLAAGHPQRAKRTCWTPIRIRLQARAIAALLVGLRGNRAGRPTNFRVRGA